MYGDIILPIGELTMEDLSRHLSRFILEVRKKDGREFPPESLHHVVCGIQRFTVQWKAISEFFQRFFLC